MQRTTVIIYESWFEWNQWNFETNKRSWVECFNIANFKASQWCCPSDICVLFRPMIFVMTCLLSFGPLKILVLSLYVLFIFSLSRSLYLLKYFSMRSLYLFVKQKKCFKCKAHWKTSVLWNLSPVNKKVRSIILCVCGVHSKEIL